ncbi:hypothetical protein [Cupriavidus basilensis]|uniref:Uncharacterized protein n=1 Tax=Cupriavidus basilensis TaxID=68895 RepID=A0A0C4Y8C1_9BURK|nr:hypothetical protein [Cupriavidus basilensis]AJG19193.1 hypothetical protein RR42_m1796 [Cupriavidus basilensis]
MPDHYGEIYRMQFYLLGPNGEPVKESRMQTHQEFLTGRFKRFVLRTDLIEQSARVWTCFCPWSEMMDPPVFLTHLSAPGVDKIFTSPTWQDAQDKHRRVSDKARRVLPLTPLPGSP